MLRKTLIFAAVFAGFIAAFAALAQAQADPPTYYLSMRGLTTEAVASFVLVTRTDDAAHSSPLAACDELTYYLTPADAAAVAASRAAGELVQLHRAETGQTPQQAAIMCILDAAGSQ